MRSGSRADSNKWLWSGSRADLIIAWLAKIQVHGLTQTSRVDQVQGLIQTSKFGKIPVFWPKRLIPEISSKGLDQSQWLIHRLTKKTKSNSRICFTVSLTCDGQPRRPPKRLISEIILETIRIGVNGWFTNSQRKQNPILGLVSLSALQATVSLAGDPND